jgi:ribosomal protein S17E
MKKNLFEMSNSEKLRILEMHYKASGKTLLKEQGETTPPTPEAQTQQTPKIDWSEGGKKTWETADINKLIEFIKSEDSQFAFSRSPIYIAMLEWFKDHPDALTRQSLKSWAGSSAVTKGGESEKKDFETKASSVIMSTNPNSKLMRNRLTNYVTKDGTKKAEVDNLLKQLDRIYKEYVAFRKKGIYPDVDTSNEIIQNLETISQGLKPSGELIKFGEDSDQLLNIPELTTTLSQIDIITAAKDSGNVVNKTNDETSKTQIITQFNIEAAEKLEDKDFLDGFFRGVTPNLEGMILKAKSITIAPGDTQIVADYKKNISKEAGVVKELASITFSYPKEDLDQSQRNEQAKNMFPDDGDVLGDDGLQGLQNIVNEALKVYQDAEAQGAELKNINIRVYSSTSKVRTQYKSDKYSEANNQKLALARANVIEAKLKELIAETDLSNAENVNTLLKVVDANRGPGWNDQVSVDLAGQPLDFATAFADAPLYTYAHSKNPKLTSRFFYLGRDEKAAANASRLIGRPVSVEELENEYENVYAKWRYCMAGLDLNMLVDKNIIESDDEQEFIVAVSGSLSASIEWRGDYEKQKGGKKKKRKNKSKFWRKVYLRMTGQIGGKGAKFVRKIGCPFF